MKLEKQKQFAKNGTKKITKRRECISPFFIFSSKNIKLKILFRYYKKIIWKKKYLIISEAVNLNIKQIMIIEVNNNIKYSDCLLQ